MRDRRPFADAPAPEDLVLAEDTIHVWCVPLTASARGVARFADTLHTEERRRAARYRTGDLCRAYVLARGLLRELVGGYLATPAARVRFAYGTHGKPFLHGSALRFNASDSGGRLLVAFTRSAEIGVDIEQVRPFPDGFAIAEMFFNPREFAELTACAPEDQLRAFFDCWTRKEAYLKATGEGLLAPLDAFRATDCAIELAGDASRWRVYDVAPAADAAAAVVVETREWQLYRWRFGDAEECATYCAALRARQPSASA
jgi:4'-phosphopantetheinyl transferase